MLQAANENRVQAASATSRPDVDVEGVERPVRQFSVAERTALAMLRCGRSFAEAAESSGVAASRVVEVWGAACAARSALDEASG